MKKNFKVVIFIFVVLLSIVVYLNSNKQRIISIESELQAPSSSDSVKIVDGLERKEYEFTFPKSGSSLKIGEQVSVVWEEPVPYKNHCSHSISLVKKNSGEEKYEVYIGKAEIGQTKLDTSFLSGFNQTCGTGGYLLPIEPGIYDMVLISRDLSSKKEFMVKSTDLTFY